jgi:hypothetical protein
MHAIIGVRARNGSVYYRIRNIGNGTFKGLGGLVPTLEGFDFDAKCNIGGFLLVRIAKRQDPEFAPNQGAKISGQAAPLQAKAVPGDK